MAVKVRSISAQLFRVVFSIYFALTLFVTSALIYVEYNLTKKSVINELHKIEQTFAPALRTALWGVDDKQLTSIYAGILRLPIIVGLKIFDAQGTIIESKGLQDSNDIRHHFSIYQIDSASSIHLADVYFYSSRSVIFERLQYGLTILLINAFVMMIALWFIFTIVFRKILTTPLRHLADEVTSLDLNNISLKRINLMATGNNELQQLEQAFNQMLETIERDKSHILENERGVQEKLERRVKARTKELVIAREEAINANQTKSVFLANMSHEMRTPMHGILSFSDIGKRKVGKVTDEKLQGYFLQIETCGNRLMGLLNDLLDLAKLESGKMELYFGKHDMHTIMLSVVNEQQARIDEKALELIWQIDCNDTYATVDPARIAQVMSNVLSNAIKFTPDGHSINITLSEDEMTLGEPALRLTIKDQGIGIPEDELGAVFDKFIQSSKHRSGAGGTGLGLAISNEITLLHLGKIWADKSTDGALFHIVVPREHQTAINLDLQPPAPTPKAP